MPKELEDMMDEDRLRKRGLFCFDKRSLKGVFASVCNYLNGWSQTLARSMQLWDVRQWTQAGHGKQQLDIGKTGFTMKFFKS